MPPANTSSLGVEYPDDATAVLTLNRPDRRNALNIDLMERLGAALDELAADSQRRVMILRAAGPVFCAGLDLHEAADTSLADRSSELVARTFQALLESPLVTIAAAQGAAMGGGGGLLACCDFVVATDGLRIGFPEVRRGLVPALVTGVLRHRVGDADLRELFLLAEPVPADVAYRMGLVQRIVPEADLFEAALQLAATVRQGGPQALRETKRLLALARGATDAALSEQAVESLKQIRTSPEALEGLAAFRERRPPSWAQRADGTEGMRR
jgi:methylglutaconyl-CoA hydratase